jgi:hypothetical protein
MRGNEDSVMTVAHRPSAFWLEVIRRLENVHKNEAWLARRLAVPAQTLSSWKQRNQLRRACVHTLAELLHWEALDDEAAEQLGVELIEGRLSARVDAHPTEEMLRRINHEYRVAEKTFKRYAGHASRVISTLGEQCFYAFSAPTNTPYEFESTPEGRIIATAIGKALCQGTSCLYIRPNDEGVSYYRDTWSYGQLVDQKQAMKEMVAFRDQIKGWMVRGELEGLPKMKVAEADRILHERLDQCYVTRSPMWMPGVSLSMIGWTHCRELKARMIINLPGARFGGMLVYPRYLTLEFRFLRFVRAVVLEACKEFQGQREGRTEGSVQLIMPADETSRKQMARFYEKYSQLLRSVYSIEPEEGALG